MDKKPCYREIAKELSKFIANEFHFCPISENITVENCDCWGSEKCAECILKHSSELKKG